MAGDNFKIVPLTLASSYFVLSGIIALVKALLAISEDQVLSESQLVKIKELRDSYKILSMETSDNDFIIEAAAKANINVNECRQKIKQFIDNCEIVIKTLKRDPYPKVVFFGVEMSPAIIKLALTYFASAISWTANNFIALISEKSEEA
jgi:hypothetical protein